MTVDRHLTADPFARSLIAGFIASTAMQLAFGLTCIAVLVLLGALHNAPPWTATTYAWLQALRGSGLVDLAGPTLYRAMGLYMVGGLLWAIAYVHFFEHRLSGPRWERGLVFASVPWFFSVVALLPVAQDGGLLGLGLGAGPLPLLGSLALHAIYGLTLSHLAGPFGDGPLGHAAASDAQVAALQSAEARAAAGVVAGLVLGAALGLVLVNSLQSAGDPTRVGLNPLALLSATTVVGAAFGGMVGSFFGLARAEV